MDAVILDVRPGRVVPGGAVTIDGRDLPVPADGPPRAFVGSAAAHVLLATPHRLRVIVPTDADGGRTSVRLDELPGQSASIDVARTVTTGVHQVDSPAFGADGRLYCTMSGGRGTQNPVPLFRVGLDGTREPIAVEIGNPTSLALGPDGRLYVSSRFDGQVFRLTVEDRAELYATDLGTATGLAFGRDGSLFVGDRGGMIFRVSSDREVTPFAPVPPSIAAFHLAMGPDDCLYVSAPTLATRDVLYRVRPDRTVETIDVGFGRPQGLAFGPDGRLYVVEALAGVAGLYRVDVGQATPAPELVVSAPSLVGVAFDPAGAMFLASADTIWTF